MALTDLIPPIVDNDEFATVVEYSIGITLYNNQLTRQQRKLLTEAIQQSFNVLHTKMHLIAPDNRAKIVGAVYTSLGGNRDMAATEERTHE